MDDRTDEDNREDVKEDKTVSKSLGDKLYILQETNKVQEDRYIVLPKYLDSLIADFDNGVVYLLYNLSM